MIKAVILDLDDTLCLTEETCYRLENEVLLKMGRPSMSRELHKATWGRPLFEAIYERSPGIDLESFRVAYEPIIKKYVENGDLDAIPPENIAALQDLTSLGKELILLTSRTHTELSHVLAPTHVLSGHISTFYYRDNMQYHKPDPRAFVHIENDHHWQANECVYVGDSVSDAVSAKGAGLYFIASLESGLRTEADFKDHEVDTFIHTFPEAVQAVKQIESKLT